MQLRLSGIDPASGTAAVGFEMYLYLAVSAAAALLFSAAVFALWTWFVFAVVRGSVIRNGRNPTGWTVFVYLTGVFGLIAWDITRRRSS